ncbi:hypothetical protein LCGC14_0302970 [marine sediment metagenome]|uniref:Uncharacterized protein n=1 Tax=marine sediment metagenome TaxID=412755 RepID=A0A0F9WB88_9ZZZZ
MNVLALVFGTVFGFLALGMIIVQLIEIWLGGDDPTPRDKIKDIVERT